MRHLVRTAILVVVVMAIFTGAIFPPEKNLRLGKDLSGGVSLVYSLAIGPGEDSASTISRTIDVLKRRVDPDGLFEISMVAQGRDRIEITMPLPNERVKALRAAYDRALDDIGRLALDEREFTRLMAMESTAREAEIARISAGSDALGTNLRDAARAADAGRDASRAVATAIASSAPPEEVNALAALKADADSRFDTIRDRVLRSSLTSDMVRQALSLSDRGSSLEDATTRNMVPIPSPRERALTQLRADYPEAGPQLDAAIAAHAEYVKERRTLDDPQDLVRLLRGAGVLTFRITVDPGTHPEEARLRQELRDKGPANVQSEDARWYRVNQIRTWYNTVQDYEFLTASAAGFFQSRGYTGAEWGGDYYILCWDVRGSRLTPLEGQWACQGAQQQSDSKGRPGIGFSMDPRGSVLLGQLTAAHVGDQMAVLLDDEVYTAPNLNSEISSSGIIEGVFTAEELNYIVRVLSAGSLQAKLSREPISQITIGPELGLDNLKAGLRAGIWAFIIVSIFMVVYYFRYGVVAVIALLATAVMILGAMSLQAAAFSLPGIAGIVLTFGQAVDANVLIYERVREELRSGKDLRAAMRLGYDRAFSSIVDGNVTNLIVCVVLVLPGIATPEIKGFGIALGLGVLATLFAGLVISRLIFDLLLLAGVRKMRMLPMVWPAFERLLVPKINWMRLRWYFVGISTAYMLLGLGMVVIRGEKMLDNEFLGGTKLTLQLRDNPDGTPMTLTRSEVADRVAALVGTADEAAAAAARAAQAPDATEAVRRNAADLQRRAQVLGDLRNAEVVPINPRADGVTSDRFSIKTLIADADLLLRTITDGFSDVVDSKPAYDFAGSTTSPQNVMTGPVYAVVSQRLGDDIGDPRFTDDVTDFQGGVAIVLRNITPTPSLDDLRESLEQMRQKSDYSGTLSRARDIRVLDGTNEAVTSAVILVRDENYGFFENRDRWLANVAQREWTMTTAALTNPTTLAQVENFSPAVAQTIKAQAIAAVVLSCLLILIYVWVRFGSMRYSMAAIATTVHDALTVVGFVALASLAYENQATAAIAQSLGILPFKIDLNMVAAILTIIGFSLNDTIIILDRIRETKGKLPYATEKIINDSINQTISRTIITSGTTLFSSVVLYVVGGEGVRAFAYALTLGVIVGTYSSIAIAAPVVWSRKHDKIQSEDEAQAAAKAGAGTPPPALPPGARTT